MANPELSKWAGRIRRAKREIVIFLTGVIFAPAFVSLVQGKFKAENVIVCTAAVGFLVLMVLSIFLYDEIADASRKLHESLSQDNKELTKRIGTVRYIDDPTDDTQNKGDSNRVYAELTDLVCSAKTEILALSLSAIGDRDFSPNNAEVRKKYFDAILDQVNAKRENFRYSRIVQIPENRWNENLDRTLGKMMVEHAKTALKMARIMPPRNVTVKKIKTQRLTGFVVVDRVTLIIVIGGITDSGNPYHKGLFVFERPPGDPLIEKYVSYFEFLNNHDNALPLQAIKV